MYFKCVFFSSDTCEFSVPQLECPLGGNNKQGSHVYFLLQVFWVILLFDINVVLMLPCWPEVTIVQSDITIVVPWQLSTGSKHDYFLATVPIVGILFKVLRIESILDLCTWYIQPMTFIQVVYVMCIPFHPSVYIKLDEGVRWLGPQI